MEKRAGGTSRVLMSLAIGSSLAFGLLVAFSLHLPAQAQAVGSLVEPRSVVQAGRARLELEDDGAVAARMPAAPEAFLNIAVNYAHDWVAGETDPSVPITVTLTDSSHALKDEAYLTAATDGSFFTDCGQWNSGSCPDIAVGDGVTVEVPGEMAIVDPVGQITIALDGASNTVSGEVYADPFTSTLDLDCMVWIENGDAPIVTTTVDPQGGSYACDFDDAGWDLQKGETVAVAYTQPDVNRVFNIGVWPSTRVNYAHDWVGGDYEAGHTFWITVTDSGGSVKGTAVSQSQPGGGWGGDGFETDEGGWQASPPDITVGDWVYLRADDGYTNAVNVGAVNGTLDLAADLVSGTLDAPEFTDVPTLSVECHPWGAWEHGLNDVPVRESSAGPTGDPAFSCQWDPDTEWDITFNDNVGVMYLEPDLDRVMNVFNQSTPDLSVAKWVEGEPFVAPEGRVVFNVQFNNDGEGQAERVVLTDTLPAGMSYVTATSSVDPAELGGQLVWSYDALEPGSGEHFRLVLEVSAAPGVTLVNQVDVGAPNDLNPDNNHTEAQVDVVEEQPDLNINKDAQPQDPSPGETFLYAIDVGNNGPVASRAVILTDTLPSGTSLIGWSSENRYDLWDDSQSTADRLVLTAPSLPGNWGDRLWVRLALGDEPLGASLVNMVEIATVDDANPDDNFMIHDWATVSPPRWSGRIDKQLNGGVLVPGGEVSYHIHVENDGNVATAFTVTDTLPSGTTFVESWSSSGDESVPVVPASAEGGQVRWDLGLLEPGEAFDFDVTLDIGAANPDAPLHNCAEVSVEGPDVYPGDNVSCVDDFVRGPGPNLRVRKHSEWQGAERLTYHIGFENIGDEAVSGVAVTDTLPMNMIWLGEWWLEGGEERLEGFDPPGSEAVWHFSEIYPAETFWLHFNVEPVSPTQPLLWYTNTVECATPPGDTAPADNFDEDVAFSGGEVRQVDLRVESDNADIWGQAVPDSPVTVEAPAGIFEAYADPGCDGCWGLGDIGPVYAGDTVTVSAGDGLLPVGIEVPAPFSATASAATGTVAGQIDHLDGELVEVDLYEGPMRVVGTDASGHYTATFGAYPRGGEGDVRYSTQINYAAVTFHRHFRSPDLVIRVNYADDSIDGQAPPNTDIEMILTDPEGGFLYLGRTSTDDQGNFSAGCDSWLSHDTCPDLQPSQWVHAYAGTGDSASVKIGTITGTRDLGADTISGTVHAEWFTDTLTGRCSVWEENGPQAFFSVEPAGGSYSCDFSTFGWDLLGRHVVAVQYYEPDSDAVLNVFTDGRPDLRMEKSAFGTEPGTGANMAFEIQIRNDGDAQATGVVVTDTMDGLTYLSDTLGIPHVGGGSGPLTWDLGVVDPGVQLSYVVYAQVDAGPGETVTNTVEVTTSSPFEAGDPEELHSQWAGVVADAGSQLSVGKDARTGDPAPKEMVVFDVNVCNNSPVASSNIVLTDTLSGPLTLVTWWADWPGWQELTSGDSGLVASLPSLPGGHCSQISVWAQVGSEAAPGDPAGNHVVIAASNDESAGDDEAGVEVWVSPPYVNLAIDKWFNGGSLTPGGAVRYGLQFWNDGNVAVTGTILITDVLPAGTTFVASWLDSPGGPAPFSPVDVTADHVVWSLEDGLPNGFSGDIGIELSIDPEATEGAILTNTVEIQPQPDEGNVEDNVSSWVESIDEPAPNLRVRKDGQWEDWGMAAPAAVYGVAVENVGSTLVEHVTVVDQLPDDLELAGEPDLPWDWVEDWQYDGQTNVLTVTYGWLAAGETAWLNFGAVFPGDGPAPLGETFTNTVEVLPAPDETVLGDNVASAVLTTGPDLFVEKDLAGGQPLPGEVITFTLRFGNDRHGHEWWWNQQGMALLTDTLPAAFEVVSSTLHWCGDREWCGIEHAVDGEEVTWELWPLDAGSWNEIQLSVRLTETVTGLDSFVNEVEIGSDQPLTDTEPNYGNNTDSYAVAVALPHLEVEKTYESNRVAGMPVTYTLGVANEGHVAASNVVLSDTLSAGLSNLDSDGTIEGETVTWAWPNLDVGEIVTGWISADLPCSGTVANSDYGVSADNLGVVYPAGDPISFSVLEPIITAEARHQPDPAEVGQTVFLLGSSSTNGTGLTASWDFGDGGSASGLGATHVYTEAGTYTATLTVVDGCGYGESDTTEVHVEAVTFELTKSYESTEVAGMPVTYTLVVTNTGVFAAESVVLSDTLPAELSNLDSDGLVDGSTVTWTWPALDAGQTVTGWISADLPCSGTVANSDYGVVSSNEGVTRTAGVPVSFIVEAPTLNAAFDQSSASGVVGTTFDFTATVTTDGPAVQEWRWDFGDGETDTEQTVSHEYVDDGMFTVQLTVTDTCGYSDVVTSTVTVSPPDLVADFDYSPKPAFILVDETVTFTDTSTTDGPSLAAWRWDFGDGSALTFTQNAGHTYAAPGIYSVGLVVTDTLGYSAQETKTDLVVVSPDCTELIEATFTYAPLEPVILSPVVFTATHRPLDATGPITYTWDFGDGATAEGLAAVVEHTYVVSGTHEASVSATNSCTPEGVSHSEVLTVRPVRVFLPLVLRGF